VKEKKAKVDKKALKEEKKRLKEDKKNLKSGRKKHEDDKKIFGVSRRKLITLGVIVVILLGAWTVVWKTGLFGINAEKLPLVPALSEQELSDYYKEALSYKTIATRNVKKPITLEFSKVDSSTKKRVVIAYQTIEQQLNSESYDDTFFMTKGQHDHFKAMLDGLSLSRDKVKEVKQTMGYYYITVGYKVRSQGTGSFNGLVNYVGINGGLTGSSDGAAAVNEQFMGTATARVQKAQAEKAKETGKEMNIPAKPNKDAGKTISKGAETRKSSCDIAEINQYAGSSKSQMSFIPEIHAIYNVAAASDNLSGYGIFPQGAFGVINFGYNRDKMQGNMDITYVFKQDLLDENKMTYEFGFIDNV